MWTFIQKDDVETFLNKYPHLAEGFEDIKLYETEDNIFLPRLFYKNFPNGIKVFESRETPRFEPTFFKFSGKLRPEQVDIVQSIINTYNENHGQINGIIKARPGLGRLIATF